MGSEPRSLRAIVPAGLFTLALGVRALPWPSVFADGRVQFPDPDAYYHMRRVLYTLEHFPRSLGFDPYLNHPHGASAIWTPLFDWLLAFFLLPLHQLAGEAAVERAAAWAPPLLGAATVVVLYFFARRLFGFAVALVSGLVLCVLPGHFWYSQLGFVDHHAAVALASTALLVSSAHLVSRRGASGRRAAVGVGLSAALALLLWPGALLYVAIVELGFLVHLLGLEDRPAAARFAGSLAAAHTVGFVLLLPAGFADTAQWGRFAPTVLSAFQPWLFGVLALTSAGAAFLWQRGRGATTPERAVQLGALGGVLLLGSLLVFSGLAAAPVEMWRWLAREEVFQSLVNESQPLLRENAGLGVGLAERMLSRFVYLVPVALFLLAREARRGEGRPELHLLVLWSLVLAIVTLAQRRFFNSFSVVLALLVGWSVVRAYAVAFARWPRRRAWALALVWACTLFLLAPVFAAYAPPVHTRFEKAMRDANLAAAWMRSATPETAGYLGPGNPEYGVMGQWNYGHGMVYRARRPAVVGNFGDDLGGTNFEASLAYFDAGEAEGVEIAERLRARYVLVQTLPSKQLGEADPATLLRRFSEPDAAGLEHHRLVYETPALGGAGRDRSRFRVFEVVKGARLVGRADPGAPVHATLSYTTPSGRETTQEFSSTADAEGFYALTLPYATLGSPPAVVPAGPYSLAAGGRSVAVDVPEPAVRAGTRLTGPDLRSVPR